MNPVIDYGVFKPLSENQDVINDFIDKTRENGDLTIIETEENNSVNVYDSIEDFFGFRLITDEQNNLVSFYPIFVTGSGHNSIIKGITESENIFEATRSISLFNAYINTFALDHVFHRSILPEILGNNVKISFAGYVHSLERQLNPPIIKQDDGKMVTTKGSSIFYNANTKPLFDFIYQFKIDEVNSILWQEFIEIIQIKAVLFRHSHGIIDVNLYATERVLQNNYYPKVGDDIMGIMKLCTSMY